MKCTNCGRKMSDDARFCEICGTPVSAQKSQAAKSKPEVDPHYDLSVFSDNSDASPKPQRQAPARQTTVVDDSAKTELLPENEKTFADRPKRPVRRQTSARAETALPEDDSAKTELLTDDNDQPGELNRFEDNLAMRRRYKADQTRSGYADKNNAPPLRSNYRDPGVFRDEPQDYQPAEPNNYQDDYRDSNPYANAPGQRSNRFDDRYDGRNNSRHHDGSPKKGKQKKALIISLIALILVIAILGSVIFIFKRNSVSASELQEAKDSYEPPAKVVQIDTSLENPSNDDIRFELDDRARIISCAYSANKKPYEQNYSYRDAERQLDIETTYKDKQIEKKTISYDQVKTANTIEDIDGYYVRLDTESMNATIENPSPIPETQENEPNAIPKEDATEWALTDAELNDTDYNELESFLQRFVSCYAFNVGEFEYNYTDKQSTNILEKVCQQFSIADWELYSGNARIEGWYQSSSNYTGLSPADAPWMDESKVNGAMGVVANRCDTADWICTNIFNVNAADLPTLYERGYAEQKLWKSESSIGTSYCAIIYGRGSIGFYANIRDVKTDGQYYYVTYDRCDPYSKDPVETLYAVMEKKTIDGGTYWSMYSNTNNIPETITPFTPER